MRLIKFLIVVVLLFICAVLVDSVFAQPYSPSYIYSELPAFVPGGEVQSFFNINIPEHTFINRLRVRIGLTGANTTNIGIGLTHGTFYTDLFLYRGNGTDITNTILDDGAPNLLVNATNPFTGYFQPDQEVSQDDFQTFAGDSTDGSPWVLNIWNVDQNNAQLTEWSLEVNNILLPVEMTSFTAMGGDKKVVLNWHTETESNNAHFNLYRSTSSTQVGNRIAQVDGHGTVSTPHDYNFTDTQVQNGIRYFYRIADVDMNGVEHIHSNVVNAVPRAGPDELPEQSALSQNYPNPFNPTTEIAYYIKSAGNVRLSVYDVTGKRITELVNGNQAVGAYKAQLDASHLPSGTYFYTLRTKGEVDTKRMILMK